MWRPLLRSYHVPVRSSAYACLSAADIDYFRSFLPESSVLTEDTQAYNVDWLKMNKGRTPLVLKPCTTPHVQKILRYCSDKKLAVCPQGGRTGLVLGGVPIHDEIVLSLSNLNRILELDAQQGIVRCEAGVVLEKLHSYAQERGYIVPLDLGSKGSCHIGGNIATNAGGIRYLRYGSLRGTVLGLEVVLPDGSVIENLQSMRKDNSGYDLKQLFIGSEGTLGIITKLALLLSPKPKSTQVVFFSCESYESMLKLFRLARSQLCEVLSAFEFMDHETVSIVLKHIPNVMLPVQQSRFYALVEVAGSDESHDRQKLESFLERAFEEVENIDGVLAEDSKQMERIWKIRESSNPACVKEGFVSRMQNIFKYDVSVPLTHFYDIVRACRERVGDLGLTVGHGHIGDCNMHLNVVLKDLSLEHRVRDLLEPFIYDYVKNVNGSISAEHGIGLYKRDKLPYARSEIQLKYMVLFTQRMLKQQLDPRGVLNPYKVL